MFKIIKNNRLNLQGSKLLDAIFLQFWPQEKTEIRRKYLWPFVASFIVANFYYMQCLFKPDSPAQGIWQVIANEEEECSVVNGREICIAGTKTNGEYLETTEPIFYYAFVILFFN